MIEDEKLTKKRSRLIVRLASFLISHSTFFSVGFLICGYVGFVILPLFAMNTYFSENALLPGSANPMFSYQDVNEAQNFVKDVLERAMTEHGRKIEIPKLIEQRITDAGGEAYHHKFSAHNPHFHPLQFFASSPTYSNTKYNHSSLSYGLNSVGIIRAPRGDGKEAIVLVTPYNSSNIQLNDAVSLGLGFSVFSFLSRITWLAKDIVWLASDSQHGEYKAVLEWLTEYHNPDFSSNLKDIDFGMCFGKKNQHQCGNSNVFKRPGTMTAALVFKVLENKGRNERDRLDICAEATNGQMPNLDLINVAHFLAVHRQGFRAVVGTIDSFYNSQWLWFIGNILEGGTKLVKSLYPQSKYETTSSEFVEGTATLASSFLHQALGVPTGSHGAFRDYQVDAISLELSPKTYLNNANVQYAFLLRSGRMIEGVIRSVNNLLEKFHHSYFLYLLTAPNKFVSVGIYMIPFALIVAPLPIVAAALFTSDKPTAVKSSQKGEKDDTWKWIPAAKLAFLIHIWACMVALLPYQISQFSDMNSTSKVLLWILLSFAALALSHRAGLSSSSKRSDITNDWKILKAVTIAAAFIGLCLMSIINYATAQIGAMLLVPMCLIIRPYRVSRLVFTACNAIFIAVGFPPFGLVIIKGMCEGFENVSIGDFWNWSEILWSWNSATYMYMLLVHLPCWVLSLHIFMHRS